VGHALPRLHEFLPTGTLLEIAPGHGRWTDYLLDHCDRLIGVDLAEKCVEACRRRFADRPHATFHKNDGRSLGMVGDGEIDFAMSFDSLVHCEADVVESYVRELARTLSEHGAAFIHHRISPPTVTRTPASCRFARAGGAERR
jgi:cyclopropane fatty-acyl-phospholipid synthase-like methyltransferase